MVLDLVRCIYYLIWFKKSKVQVQTPLNSGNKINAMILGYVLKLGLKVCFINVEAQKIYNSTFEIFKMVLASFQVENTLGRAWFFQKMFLLTDFRIEVV